MANKKLLKVLANTLNNLGTSALITGIFAVGIWESVGIIQLALGVGGVVSGLLMIIASWLFEMSTEDPED